MRKALILLLILAIASAAYFSLKPKILKIECIKNNEPVINEAFRLLRARKDKDALAILQDALANEPDNLDALWVKAEIGRRARQYKQSESILNSILTKNPKHIPSLISLAYIKDKQAKTDEALQLISGVLKDECSTSENRALAYMMIAVINARLSSRGGFFNKIKYGTQIKRFFLKAKELAPDLPEVRAGLGQFYLLAPVIAGGNLNKAIEELKAAVKIAPDFATANARLAQCYKRKGIEDKYKFYINRAKELDPDNEVIKEIE